MWLATEEGRSRIEGRDMKTSEEDERTLRRSVPLKR